MLLHGWQITQIAKLVAKQTEINLEKRHILLPHNKYFDKQTGGKTKK